MNKNKKIFFCYIVITTIIAGISGCSKFLDRKPLSATLDDLNQGTLEAQSLGLYNQLTYDAGFSTLPWLDFNSIRDDDAQKGSSTTDGAEINTEFETFQYTKDDWATNTYWGDHYSMINAANKELYYADSLKLSDENSLRNVGEARFFRAYSFFELVKAYGDIPLINYYYTNAKDGIKPKSPAADIYKQIDSDLVVAAKLLPLNWKNASGTNTYPGRLTSGAALTLRAQTYLFRATPNWDSVIALCSQVELTGQYSLTHNFVDIWKDGLNGEGKNGPESIFEMQALLGQNGSNDYGSFWGVCQNVRQGGAPAVWNLGWGWNVPTQVLQNAWDSTDPRKASTILYSGQYDGGPATGGYGSTLPDYAPGAGLDQPFWSKKVYSDPNMRSYTGTVTSGYPDWINHRILRYADVLLMLAEAYNEKNNGPKAAFYLEQVRDRASGNLGPTRTIVPPITYQDQSQMRTAIKNERRWEFAMEGYRFYDLVRWGDASTALGSLGYQSKNALYPIPQPIITQFGGVLVQNPNY